MEVINNRITIKYFFILVIISSFSFSIEKMNIDSVIEYALKNSTAMKIAIKDKDISNARSLESQSTALPTLNGMVSGLRNYNIATQTVIIDDNPISMKFGQDNQISYGLTFKQTIFESRVFAAIRASKIYDEMTGFAYEMQVLSIMEKTHIAFYNTILTMEIRKVLSASLDRAKSNLKKMSLMFSFGKASELDKIKSESIVLNLTSDLLMADQKYNVALASLKKNIGFPISNDLVLIGDFMDEKIMDVNMEILLDKMMKFQPGLKYAKKSVELIKENVSSVRSELLPNLHLFGTYNFFNNFNDDNYLKDDYSSDQMIGVNLNIPIYNGFGSKARLRIAKAEYAKSEYRQLDIIANFRLELENVVRQIESLSNKINADLKSVELAKKGQEVAYSLFENGKISQMEMENAELFFLESELVLLQSKLQYQISLAALHRLIGGKEFLHAN